MSLTYLKMVEILVCHQVPSEEKLMINLQYDREKEEVIEYNQIVNQTLILLTNIIIFKKDQISNSTLTVSFVFLTKIYSEFY